MESDRSKLDDVRREVNHSLAVGALANFELPVEGRDDGHPVIVALEDEALGVALGRVRAVGGSANLFVPGDEGVYIISVVHALDAARRLDGSTGE